jgi:hypothetical protein
LSSGIRLLESLQDFVTEVRDDFGSIEYEVSLSVDMLLSAVSVLVIVLQSSEIPEGLMNNPVLYIAAFAWTD